MDERTGVCSLARCHGYRVVSGERLIGEVETPVFAGPLVEPEFLLLRMGELLTGTFRMLPAALVVDVDPTLRQVAVEPDDERLIALPEHLPVLTATPRRACGVVGTPPSRRAGLGTQEQLLPAEPGRGRRDC